jgi:hypothetical protein
MDATRRQFFSRTSRSTGRWRNPARWPLAASSRSATFREFGTPPPGLVDIGPPTAPGERALPGAAAVVAGLRGGFRSWYNAGLGVDPTMAGHVRVRAKVATNGEVATAAATANAGLSDSVVQCLVKKLRTAQFDAGPTATTREVPVTFVQQGK